MTEFAAHLNLGTLSADQGYAINGVVTGDQSGIAVSGAGDINGDGFDDIVIGAPGADDFGKSGSGTSYVVFGRAATSGPLDLATLDGSQGFAVFGAVANQHSGAAVASAGDINNDGFDDLLVGAPGSGFSYVKFGRGGGYSAGFTLQSIDGVNGFRVEGPDPFNITGGAVSSAGDFNGDGFDDFLLGAPDSDNVGAYLLYGHGGGYPASFDLGDLDSSTGFQIRNAAEPQSVQLGAALASGDFDGDGLSDLIVGAPTGDSSSRGYIAVIYGHAGGGANVDVADLNGANGFQIHGEQNNGLAGKSVSTADINADGFADIIIGAPAVDAGGPVDSGASYVIYGGPGRGYVDVDLATLLPGDGFALDGEGANNMSGRSVSSAGDVNGDGFEDLLIGAPQTTQSGSNSGAAYVLFGRADHYPNINLGAIDGANGFVIDGAASGNLAGFSVSAAGDVNNDGFDDIIVGAYGRSPHGSQSGTSYVVYGHRALESVNRQGTDIAQTINGGFGQDFINGGGGGDTLIGWESSDALEGGLGRDVLRGGSGDDGYILSDSFLVLGPGLTRTVDTVVENFGEGVDTVHVVAFAGARKGQIGSYTLTANVENGEISGSLNFNLTGNTLGNSLTGSNDGANTLRGLEGADALNGLDGLDRLEGGTGDDAYFISDVNNVGGTLVFDTIVEAAGAGFDTVFVGVISPSAGSPTSYRLGANVENGRVFFGSNFGLVGNGLGNELTGDGTSNVLDGGAGADFMVGGDGNDTYFVDQAGDFVVEHAGGGRDIVAARASYTLAARAQVEDLRTSSSGGTAAIDLTGNEFAQNVTGNAGDNVLDGRGGADTMNGGRGDDVYFVDVAGPAGDRIVEVAGGGNDTVAARVSFTLASGVGVETIRTSNNAGVIAINLAGNELDNAIIGNAGVNVLNGHGGGDVMTGLGGADAFVFDRALGVDNVDAIRDFAHLGDEIRLDQDVFTTLSVGALASSAFKDITAGAEDADDRILYRSDIGALYYDADGAGGANAVRFAMLENQPAVITAGDFVVIA